MNFLKKIMPFWFKQIILKLLDLIQMLILPIFSKNSLFASLYYLVISRKFGREHHAVLAGRLAYKRSLMRVKSTSVLLRRNTHRLEKGLIMRPRRDVFAEDYIGETVRVYQQALHHGSLCPEEKKWCKDVLKEYFSVVKSTNKIAKIRAVFESINTEEVADQYIPYRFDALPQSVLSFDELHQLFLKRRSVRWYQDKIVSTDLLEKAINIAALAPSACNRQPYSFYISKNKEDAIQMAKCAGGTVGWAENIPCTIVIVGDLSAYPLERDRHVIYIDASLAAMQLMLALETLGLSTCSINWPDIENSERAMKKLLGLENYQRPVMLLSVGYALESGGIPYSQKKRSDTLIKTIQIGEYI